MAKKQAVRSAGKKRKAKRKTNYTGFVCLGILVVMTAAAVGAFSAGKSYYKNKFLASTTINGVDVSSLSLDEAKNKVINSAVPETLEISGLGGTKISLKTADFNYKTNAEEEIGKIYDKVNHASWLSGFIDGTDYKFEQKYSFDKAKLAAMLKSAKWGDTPSSNAVIKKNGNKYEITEEVQGNKIADMDKLVSEITGLVDDGKFNIELNEKSGCYEIPKVTADSLAVKCDNLNKVGNISIGYDFIYTVEKLTGEKLLDLLDVNDDGTYTPNHKKCEKYVEWLGKKYDTYNKERKFKSTLQGVIIVPKSSDAKYGWWIDQEKTTAQLEELLRKGKSVKKIEPIYYEEGGYTFTGMRSARTKNGDIGKTYVEVDLTAQYLWIYKKGKRVFECPIVSGQTTSMARTTLPGVYKVWNKQTNYRMKDTNGDGDSWDVTCNYWNRITIVGIGLHDSDRAAFGGDIYRYNGSHGCINMPLYGAKYVYDNVAMDTPVVMYYKTARPVKQPAKKTTKKKTIVKKASKEIKGFYPNPLFFGKEAE